MLLNNIKEAKRKMKEAFSDDDSNKILTVYIENSLNLIEYHLFVKNQFSEATASLLRNCVELTLEGEREPYKKVDRIILYRVWIAKLRVYADFTQRKPLNIEKVGFILSNMRKIHQNYLDKKITCLLVTYRMYQDYNSDMSLKHLWTGLFREFELLLRNQIGMGEWDFEKMMLKITTLMTSLDLSKNGKRLFIRQILAIELITMENFWSEYQKEDIEGFFERYLRIVREFFEEKADVELIEQLCELLIENKKKGDHKEEDDQEKKGGENQSKSERKRYYLKTKSKIEQRVDDRLSKDYNMYKKTTRINIEQIMNESKSKNRVPDLFEPSDLRLTMSASRGKGEPDPLVFDKYHLKNAYNLSFETGPLLSASNSKKFDYSNPLIRPISTSRGKRENGTWRNIGPSNSKGSIVKNERNSNRRLRGEGNRPVTARVVTFQNVGSSAEIKSRIGDLERGNSALMKSSINLYRAPQTEPKFVLLGSDKKSVDPNFFISYVLC